MGHREHYFDCCLPIGTQVWYGARVARLHHFEVEFNGYFGMAPQK
jgi:hypothetical protein